MTDRPTEQTLALDAIDDAFKSAMTQFAENAAISPVDRRNVDHVRSTRELMIVMVKNWEQ